MLKRVARPLCSPAGYGPDAYFVQGICLMCVILPESFEISRYNVVRATGGAASWKVRTSARTCGTPRRTSSKWWRRAHRRGRDGRPRPRSLSPTGTRRPDSLSFRNRRYASGSRALLEVTR